MATVSNQRYKEVSEICCDFEIESLDTKPIKTIIVVNIK